MHICQIFHVFSPGRKPRNENSTHDHSVVLLLNIIEKKSTGWTTMDNFGKFRKICDTFPEILGWR